MKNGTPLTPARRHEFDFGLRRLDAVIGGEPAANVFAIHAVRGGDRDQHLLVADVFAAFEIGAKQLIDDRVLHAGFRRPADQPMGA